MKHKYFFGLIASGLYRALRVFPNSDPLMGFILPAAKNEPIWKAPLFAFAAMASFDIITSRIGIWTIVTAATYTLVALAIAIEMRNKKTTLKLYIGRGAVGILAFDFITGPISGMYFFGQDFLTTLVLQIPFSAMHVLSGIIFVTLITPFLDANIMAEVKPIAISAKKLISNAFSLVRI